MRTPFGIALRQIREEKGWKLHDVAKALGVSSAFISALETGRKPIPTGLVTKLRRELRLSEKEVTALRRARDRTKPEVSVEALPGDDRELVAAFARHLGEENVDSELVDRLRARIGLKSRAGEHPFERKRRGMRVAPKSKQSLREIAEMVRSTFTMKDQVMFPIMDVLDGKLRGVFNDYDLHVLEYDEMGDYEGLVVAGDPVLRLRNDVYESACNGDGRARFTACHELAHYLLHRKLAMARMRDDSEPIYQDSEWQADVFAGGLLMSHQHVADFASVTQAANDCGMSIAAARYQLKQYGRSL